MITHYATSVWVTYEFDFILNGNSLKLYNGAYLIYGFGFTLIAMARLDKHLHLGFNLTLNDKWFELFDGSY